MKNIIYSLILLLIPFILNKSIEGFNWKLSDFVMMCALIFSCLSLVDFFKRKYRGKSKILAIIIITMVFILLWIELAVGIFGSPLAGN